MPLTLAIIVPFQDEEVYLPSLLHSIERQRRVPDLLMLVDDGSRDRSGQVAREFAARHPYVRVLQLPRRPLERDRMATASVWRAFTAGLRSLNHRYDIVAKLDADIELKPDVFRRLESEFERDPQLGIAGFHLSERDPAGTLRRHRCPPGNVEGATKFYRRSCYDEIAPVPAILGWDTIDQARARRRGWRTRTFAMAGGDPIHLRRAWAHAGILRGYRRAGRAAYTYGSHPLAVLASAAIRVKNRPAGLAAAHYLLGYTIAVLQRAPRAERELRAFIRHEQWLRVRNTLLRTTG